jgi:thiol-disulfide isomerase/thioredoxin
MKALYISLLLLAYAIPAWAGWVKITGKVTYPMDDKVQLALVTNYVDKQEKVYTAKLDAGGGFSIDMEVFAPQYVELRYAEVFKAGLFVAPGEDFEIAFNSLEFRPSMAFKGKGAPSNTFFNQYFIKYEDNTAWDLYLGTCKNHKPDVFKNSWSAHLNEELAFLEAFHQKTPLSDVFKPWMADHIRYKNINQMWDYQFNHAWENGKEPSDVVIPRSYYTFFSLGKANNDFLANSPYYNRFLDNFIWNAYNETLAAEQSAGFDEFDVRMRKELALVKKHLSGYARNKQYAKIMNEILENNEPLLYEEYSAEFEQMVDDEHLRLVVTNRFKKEEAQDRGEYLPEGAKEITVVDADGKTAPLRDILSIYQGKVVYIDFWASWCGPCLKEMPSSSILQDRLTGKEVIFLYMSNDEDEEAWRAAISKHNIKGLHIRMNSRLSAEVAQQFGIEAIPHYALVNKQGKVFKPSASSPSHPQTFADIQQLLSE